MFRTNMQVKEVPELSSAPEIFVGQMNDSNTSSALFSNGQKSSR
jgi:hypothetical protein